MFNQNPLVGKVITDLQIAPDRQALRFVLSDGECIALCDGDCCSYTWVEHLELPALGLPATVLSVHDIDMPDLGEMEGRDVVEYYGCKIITDRGELLIDYRNESNGYYGGSLIWPGDHHYGGVYNQNSSSMQWTMVSASPPIARPLTDERP